MVDIKKLKESLEVYGEMVEAGEIMEVDDDVMDRSDLSHVDFGACLPATEQNVKDIPEIWADQILYDNCYVCRQKIFYRDNMPKGIQRVCLPCAFNMMKVDTEDGEPNLMLMRKSGSDELREYVKKKEGN